MDCRFENRKTQGLFRESAINGVWAFPGRGISIGRLRGVGDDSACQYSNPGAVEAMAGSKKVAGVDVFGPRGHDSRQKRHQEQEEKTTSSPREFFGGRGIVVRACDTLG
jgi:hypothetical protein